MNVKLVEQLARLEVEGSTGMAQQAGAFVQIHTNPAFGWRIARSFARRNIPFPVDVTGRDHWLHIAYLMHLDPGTYCNHDVEAAYQISQQSGISGKLRALLIAGLGEPIEPHLNLVAEKTGIPKRTVEAYEILFFNVLERHKDGLYLSHIAYPEGRAVEFNDDYFETTPIPELLLRAAYNYRDITLVLRLAGMEDEDCVKELATLQERDAERELEARIMGNALALAQSGLINQRSVGLQRATALLAGSRSSRMKTQSVAETSDFGSISNDLAAALNSAPPITEADRQDLLASSCPGQSYFSDETGEVFAMDSPYDASTPLPSVPNPKPIEHFEKPVSGVWRNKDFDKPVTIVARMSEPGLPDHYLTDVNTGIPVSEVFFEN